MSEGGLYTVTNGNGLPGCSLRDMICRLPLAKLKHMHMFKIDLQRICLQAFPNRFYSWKDNHCVQGGPHATQYIEYR